MRDRQPSRPAAQVEAPRPATAAPQPGFARAPEPAGGGESDSSQAREERPRIGAPATADAERAERLALDDAMAKRRASSGRTASGGKPDEFQVLLERTVQNADEARRLRDEWRAFAARNPGGARGDEARVRVIEAGLLAHELGGDEQDLDTLRNDARAYLARPDAAQAARVRAVLTHIER
jgi:hypothetical protein